MPRLQLFAPCERALIDQGSGATSLVTVLQTLTIPEPPVNTPSNAIAIQRWSAVSMWMMSEGDETKRFQQLVTLVNPTGAPVFRTQADFGFPKAFHRIVATIHGFPLQPPGEYHLELALREFGAADWTLVSSYSLFLRYTSQGKPSPASSSL